MSTSALSELGKLSPHRVGLCVLVRLALQSRARDTSNGQLLLWVIGQLKNVKTFLEPDMKTLIQGLQDVAPSCTSSFVSTLETLLDPDTLFDFLSECNSYLVDGNAAPAHDSTVVDRTSPIGLFLRTTLLLFDTAPFSEFARLSGDLELYVKGVELHTIVAPSDINAILYKKIQEFESMIGRVSYDETEASIMELLASGIAVTEIPMLHFLRYLNCLHHKEFESGLDNLHRYFDYYCSRDMISSNDNHNIDADEKKALSQQRPLHHYAILNLAIFHLTFGHEDIAAQAIQETVQMAEQNNDNVCLTLALGLLWRIQQSKGEGADATYAATILARPIEGSSSIMSARVDSHLFTAQSHLKFADPDIKQRDPKDLWFSLGEAEGAAAEYKLHAHLARAHLTRAAAWKQYGNAFLSSLNAMRHLLFFTPYSSARDVFLSMNNLSREPDVDFRVVADTQSIWGTETTLPVEKGVDELTLSSEITRALASGNETLASQLADQMNSLVPCSGNKLDFAFHSMYIQILLKMSRGQVQLACMDALRLQHACEHHGRLLESVKLLLLLAELYRNTGNSLGALPCVMRAISLCQNHYLDSLHAEARLALADLHLALGAPQRGARVIREVFSHILEHCEPNVKIRASILLSKCLLNTNNGKSEQLGTVIQILQGATDWCQHGQHLSADVYYLMARVYHEMGSQYRAQRNEASKLFQLHNSSFQSA